MMGTICASKIPHHSKRNPDVFHLVLLASKGKAMPVRASTGPEDSRRLRLPYFKTVGT